MTYGYAAAAEPETLQIQVEALEDAGIPVYRQYVELLRFGQQDREQFDTLIKAIKRGDTVAIYDLAALGFDLCESYKRLSKIDNKKAKIDIRCLSDGCSQDQILRDFRYFAKMYIEQKEKGITKGHPTKKYPPGWRDAYEAFQCGKKTAAELCSDLGIADYDFYRMYHRYNQSLAKRKKGR